MSESADSVRIISNYTRFSKALAEAFEKSYARLRPKEKTMKGMFPYVLNLAEAFQNKGSVKIPMADGCKIREVIEGSTSEEINLWTEVVQGTTKETFHTFLVARPGQWVPLDAKYHGFARGHFVYEMKQA